MNTTWLFIAPTLVLILILGGLLTGIIRTLVRKYLKTETKSAGKLEIGTMDVIPLLLSAVFILAILTSYLVMAALLRPWAVALLVFVLVAKTIYLAKKMIDILKRL